MALPTYGEFRVATISQRHELIGQVKQRLMQHRYQIHNDDGLERFYDCATCGVIENRLKNFEGMVRRKG